MQHNSKQAKTRVEKYDEKLVINKDFDSVVKVIPKTEQKLKINASFEEAVKAIFKIPEKPNKDDEKKKAS